MEHEMKYMKTFEEYGQEWNDNISCPNCGSVVDISMYKGLDQFKCFCGECETELQYPWGPNWRWA
jgi:hypothetical protein